ncbi:MAG: SDR family oxidoreductase [SAR202 cluster bacterium]|nr:SDR family oxidoreductase [SAR202 cluster bacterium]
MELGLKGRVAIVTGGSEGIGKAAAASMAREGARVAIVARRKDVLEKAAGEIRKKTGNQDVIAVSCDVRNETEAKAAVQSVAETWGRLDILVNNAGTSSAAKFDSVTDEMLSEDLKIKVYGAFYFSRAALPHMRKARWGRIINITTPGGKAAPGGTLPTSLSRAAGIAMTKAMSKDYAADNVLVNTVCIGLIKSGQHERRYERLKQSEPALTLESFYGNLGKTVPLGRVGEAHEAGDLICFLASEKASYISGTAINVDGGNAPVV